MRKNVEKFLKKLAFCRLTELCEVKDSDTPSWQCCSQSYTALINLQQHLSSCHQGELERIKQTIILEGDVKSSLEVFKPKKTAATNSSSAPRCRLPEAFKPDDVYAWFPSAVESEDEEQDGQILLYYKYREIEETKHVCEWQRILCQRLDLTGKIRVSHEGINATVGGSLSATNLYMKSVMNHPLFSDMNPQDFKTSKGNKSAFPAGLKVGVYEEIVSMGISPDKLSYKETGEHVSPEAFHRIVEGFIENKDETRKEAVIVDCRNFYESKITFKSGVHEWSGILEKLLKKKKVPTATLR